MPRHLSCVLLADRHHGLTEGVRGLLATAFGSVVMVADEASLIEGAGRLHPDMAIVDLSLRPDNRWAGCSRFDKAAPNSR